MSIKAGNIFILTKGLIKSNNVIAGTIFNRADKASTATGYPLYCMQIDLSNKREILLFIRDLLPIKAIIMHQQSPTAAQWQRQIVLQTNQLSGAAHSPQYFIADGEWCYNLQPEIGYCTILCGIKIQYEIYCLHSILFCFHWVAVLLWLPYNWFQDQVQSLVSDPRSSDTIKLELCKTLWWDQGGFYLFR